MVGVDDLNADALPFPMVDEAAADATDEHDRDRTALSLQRARALRWRHRHDLSGPGEDIWMLSGKLAVGFVKSSLNFVVTGTFERDQDVIASDPSAQARQAVLSDAWTRRASHQRVAHAQIELRQHSD